MNASGAQVFTVPLSAFQIAFFPERQELFTLCPAAAANAVHSEAYTRR
ncbi:MAG TPA: hypothetical protein VM182_15625 [Terriglobia bacterium]|nr:hypothetical protein [Terriglobia bacterium]